MIGSRGAFRLDLVGEDVWTWVFDEINIIGPGATPGIIDCGYGDTSLSIASMASRGRRKRNRLVISPVEALVVDGSVDGKDVDGGGCVVGDSSRKATKTSRWNSQGGSSQR